MQMVNQDPPVRTHRYLSRVERKQVLAQLWEETTVATGQPILAHGAMGRCAKNFNVSRPAISYFWKHMKKQYLQEGILTASPVKKKPSCSSQLYCRDEISREIEAIPYCRRQTVRDTANELGIGKSTVHRILRSERDEDGERFLVPHTNSLLPLLTDEHKVARVLYALSKLDQDLGSFSSFLQDVHVDEKWFEMCPRRSRVILTGKEKENHKVPICKVIHKSHIQKIMFLAATARPRFDDNGRCLFDGKIGIWPIVTRAPAARNSVNRPAGTMITKPQNVTNVIYRQMLLELVIPAIKSRFPHNRDRTITIQQDGAGAHISSNDGLFHQGLEQICGKCFCIFVCLIYH